MSSMGSGSPALPSCGQFTLLCVSKLPMQGPGRNELNHFIPSDGDENDEGNSGV